MGIILPVFLTVVTFGYFKTMTFLQFDAEPLPSKVVRKHKLSKFTEIMEYDLGIIAFWGLLTSLVLALIANGLGFGVLAAFSLYYAIWSIIPLSQLDGFKILMGSDPIDTNLAFIFPPMYIASVVLTLITALIVLI